MNKGKRKVLFVMISLYNGGAEKSLVNLLNELPEDKYEIDLLLFQRKGMFLSQVPEWVRILETPKALKRLYAPLAKTGRYGPVKLFGTLISKFIERGTAAENAYRWIHFYRKRIEKISVRYDVAIAYGAGQALYFVGDKVEAEKKYVWVHNDYVKDSSPKKYEYPYFQVFDGIVSISETCVEILEKEFPEFQEKLHYIANITSSETVRKKADEFVPDEMTGEGSSILSIGRFDPQKGFDMAISAASILKQKGVAFRWFIIGDGKLKRQMKKQIKKEGVSDCFLLLGTRKNPYPYIKKCDIFVQTSRYEGKSVVIDEAKILSKPIVVTNYPTVRDQIRDGREGIIVEMNAEAIADGIIKMMTDKEQQKKMSWYLKTHEYGNREEVEKYMDLLDR